LAIAVAIPVAVLFYFQFRSLNDLSRSSAVVLRQLSNETANGVAKTIEDELKAPHIEVLLRVTQGRTEPIDLPFIKEVVDRSFAKTPFLSRFYVWSTIDPVHREELLAYDRTTRAFIANPPEAAQLLRRVKDLVPRKRAIVAFDTTIDGRLT